MKKRKLDKKQRTQALSWLHFDDQPRVQERHQIKYQHSYIFVFVPDLTIPRSNKDQTRHENSIPCMAVQQIYRDTEELQENETSQNKSRLQFFWRRFQRSTSFIRLVKRDQQATFCSSPQCLELTIHQREVTYLTCFQSTRNISCIQYHQIFLRELQDFSNS